MVDQTRLDNLLEQLNSTLGDVTPYKLAVVPPAEIKPVDKNAHYMPKRVYDQFVSNIKRDGNLSSLPFCWRQPDGSLVSLSGNHRTQIAVQADVPLILILYTDEELSRPQQLGIQLSHNALVGQDNPSTLRELWNEIDELDYKIYAGLDEELLDTMDKVNIIRISEEGLRFEELILLFLSPEIDQIEETLKKLKKINRRRFAARYEDFDRFFEVLLDFKEAQGIVNTATALMAMIEIVEQWINEHNEAENEPED